MYYLGVLCLLSAAVALPTPEQLHTNLPAPPPPPQLKSEEERQDVVVDPPAPIPDVAIEEPDKSDEFKNPSESEGKLVNQIDEDMQNEMNLVQEESKESKESKDSKEKSKENKESKESKEFKESKEWKDPKENEKPEEPQDVKKEKDSKSQESVNKDREEEEYPVVVEVIKGPSFLDWLDKLYNLFHDIKFPSMQWPFRRSELQNVELEQQDEPVFIVKESDIDFV